jgi:PiT family inorganic phosphate transporter
VAPAQDCDQRYGGNLFGLKVRSAVDWTHYCSAAAVSFARGMNDTPKIVAPLLAVQALDIRIGVLVVGVGIAIGGLLNAHKVARTMSQRISRMSDGQALTANLVTAFLVICASRYGLPVSTTHVAVGSITGVGIVNRTADRRVISGILAAWLMTLPTGAVISMVVLLFIRSLG